MRDFNLDNAIKHLSDAVKIETVSNIDYEKVEWYKFDDFLAFLEKEYPNVHKVCKREIVNKYAPVYKWEGKQ